MTLYHGSNQTIDGIDLSICKPNKDFGQGFYLTDIHEQAQLMAKRRTRIMGEGIPTVVTYEFDTTCLDNLSLKVKIFDAPSKEPTVLLWNKKSNLLFTETMNEEQKFLIDCVVAKLVLFVMEDFHISTLEALGMVFNSQLYDKLTDLETGLHRESARHNYSYLKQELITGNPLSLPIEI